MSQHLVHAGITSEVLRKGVCRNHMMRHNGNPGGEASTVVSGAPSHESCEHLDCLPTTPTPQLLETRAQQHLHQHDRCPTPAHTRQVDRICHDARCVDCATSPGHDASCEPPGRTWHDDEPKRSCRDMIHINSPCRTGLCQNTSPSLPDRCNQYQI